MLRDFTNRPGATRHPALERRELLAAGVHLHRPQTQFRSSIHDMRFLLTILLLAAGLSAQTANNTVNTVVGRLELERYKAHIKGLTQFGDRMQGTQRNRDAIDW